MDTAKKDFLIIVIGKILQIIFMLAIIKISTRVLDANALGSIYMIMAFASFFSLTFFNPVGQYIQRHLNEWKDKKILINNLIYFIIYIIGITIIAVLVMIIYISFMGIPVDFSRTDFLILFSAYLIFIYLNLHIIFLLNLLDYRVAFIALTLFTAIGTLLLAYLAVYYFGATAENWLYGLVTSNIIVTVVAFFYLKHKLTFYRFKGNLRSIVNHDMSSLLIFVVPLALAFVFMWLQLSGYRIIVEYNIGLDFLGFLGVGLVVASQIMAVFESITQQYLYPIYYREITNTTKKARTMAINNFISKALPIYFLLAIFLTFLAKYIVFILVDEKFFTAYMFTMFGVWVEFFRMMTNLFGNIAQSEMNTKKFLIPYILGSLITMILVYFASIDSNYIFLIPLSLVAGSFFTMMLVYIYMQQLLKFSINYKSLLFTVCLGLPFLTVLFIEIGDLFIFNFTILMLYGIYFLGAIYLIYKYIIPTLEE